MKVDVIQTLERAFETILTAPLMQCQDALRMSARLVRWLQNTHPRGRVALETASKMPALLLEPDRTYLPTPDSDIVCGLLGALSKIFKTPVLVPT